MDYKILLGDASSCAGFRHPAHGRIQRHGGRSITRVKKSIRSLKKVDRDRRVNSVQGAVKRMEIREIMGDKLMREITLK